MALTPQSIEFIKKWIAADGARKAAVKIVDQCIRKAIGLTSSDMPDTTTFMHGLDAIEALLGKEKYQAAYDKGLSTAKKMIKEEGGGSLFEIRKAIKKILTEKLELDETPSNEKKYAHKYNLKVKWSKRAEWNVNILAINAETVTMWLPKGNDSAGEKEEDYIVGVNIQLLERNVELVKPGFLAKGI